MISPATSTGSEGGGGRLAGCKFNRAGLCSCGVILYVRICCLSDNLCRRVWRGVPRMLVVGVGRGIR